MSSAWNTALAPINALTASMRFLLIATRETGEHHNEPMAQCVVEIETQLARVIGAAEQIGQRHRRRSGLLAVCNDCGRNWPCPDLIAAQAIVAACRSTGDSE